MSALSEAIDIATNHYQGMQKDATKLQAAQVLAICGLAEAMQSISSDLDRIADSLRQLDVSLTVQGPVEVEQQN